jgi:hypothetical protein
MIFALKNLRQGTTEGVFAAYHPNHKQIRQKLYNLA